MEAAGESSGSAERTRVRRLFAIAWWVFFAVALGIVIFVRVRLLALPLERDEGEYAYAGQLLLRGIPPYQLAYNMKFPGAYAVYALFMAVFGESAFAIHLALLLLNLAAVALVVAIAWRMLNDLAGALVAGATYAIAAMSPSLLGLSTHVEHLALPPVLAGMLLLVRRRETRIWMRCFFAGFLLGIAILMKQPAATYLAAGFLYLLWRVWRERLPWFVVLTFVVGAFVPIALTFLAVWLAGVFPQFWFWTIQYARAYGSIVPWREGVQIALHFTPQRLAAIWPICALSGAGLIALVAHSAMRRHAMFIVLMLLASIAACASGFYFRHHYYVYLLPCFAWLVGVFVSAFTKWLHVIPRVASLCALAVSAAALSYPLVTQADILFRFDAEEACRALFHGNIFCAAPTIANFLREHSAPDDKIAVLGSEPELYFYSDRRSASGFIYMYPLMEEQPFARQMQRQLQNEVEQARPKLLVVVTVPMGWQIGPWSDLSVVDWVNRYAFASYHIIGAVNVSSAGDADYCLPCDHELNPWPASVWIAERNEP